MSRTASSAPIAAAANTASESLVTAQDSGTSGRSSNAGAASNNASARGATRLESSSARRQQRTQQHAELIHRPQRQRVRDVVGEAHLRVNCTHGIGERTAPGHDQHRPARGHLGRFRARPPQSFKPVGAKQPAADVDDQRL